MSTDQPTHTTEGFVARLKLKMATLATSAKGRYRDLVEAIAQGTPPEPSEAESILREAGKELAELEIDLRAKREVQKARVTIKAEAQTNKEFTVLQARYTSNDERLAEALRAARAAHDAERIQLDAEQATLEARRAEIEDAKRLLRVHDPDFARTDDARVRIQELQQRLNWFTNAIEQEERKLKGMVKPEAVATQTEYISTLRDQLDSVAQSMALELDLLENPAGERKQNNPAGIAERLSSKRQELARREKVWHQQEGRAKTAAAGVADSRLSGDEREVRRTGATNLRKIADQERAQIVALQREILDLEGLVAEVQEATPPAAPAAV